MSSSHSRATSSGSTELPSGRLFGLRALAFVGAFMVLQAAWEVSRGTSLETLWVRTLTVEPAAALIQWLWPQIGALAQGLRITAPGGGIQVLKGCEGADLVFLLAAAFAVFPMSARRRFLGLLLGLVLAWALNLLRVVGLFHAFRFDPTVFEWMHSIGAPLILILACGLFFHHWLERAPGAPEAPPDTGNVPLPGDAADARGLRR